MSRCSASGWLWHMPGMSDGNSAPGGFHGLFINLDSRPDRLSRMRGQFARYGLTDRYSRLRAVADQRPDAGCFRSHLQALEEAQRLGGVVHILEDDSILSNKLAPFLVSRELEQLLERYDMLHLDMWVDLTEESFSAYANALPAGVIELGM